MGSVTHTPKAGAVLTGTEYEAADHHVIALDAEDIPTHSHAGEDITSGTVADGRVASTLARDSEVTSALAAYSKMYVQAGDPGAVGGGSFWLDTSGNLNIRNSADSAWIVVISGD